MDAPLWRPLCGGPNDKQCQTIKKAALSDGAKFKHEPLCLKVGGNIGWFRRMDPDFHPGDFFVNSTFVSVLARFVTAMGNG